MDCHVQALWFHELMSWCHMELLKLLLLEHIFRKRLCLSTTPFASTTPSDKMPLFLHPTSQTTKAGTRHQRSKASHSHAWSSTQCSRVGVHGPWWERSDSPTWESQVDVAFFANSGTLSGMLGGVWFQG